ncbi:type II toxin-antitoxin system RelE/ParE family toxin [Chlorobium ferrooxidans]|uniref:type II toxin-antitoxin system RelE/ParE family toxin n=1 Tax=Chlorobium ferrooxidans TaxID=84205 RepID=UPI0005901E51
MNIEFHPAAELELTEAVDYYESMEKGLGLDFASEVIATINRIKAFPEAWPLLCHDINRSLVKRYPYGILYGIEKERIYIVAVMNLNRDPDYWEQRI